MTYIVLAGAFLLGGLSVLAGIRFLVLVPRPNMEHRAIGLGFWAVGIWLWYWFALQFAPISVSVFLVGLFAGVVLTRWSSSAIPRTP